MAAASSQIRGSPTYLLAVPWRAGPRPATPDPARSGPSAAQARRAPPHPARGPARHRGEEVRVSAPPLQLAQVLLQGVPDRGARGQPVRQPGADQRVGVEQPELTAELAVIIHGGLPGRVTGRATTGKPKPRGARPGASSVSRQ